MSRSLFRARARRLAADERGITLVEITIAVFLTSLVAAVVLAMFVGVTKSSNENNKINTDTRSASNGMNEMARMIRAATENPLANPASGVYPNESAIVAGSGLRSITLYAYVNLDSASETPVKVTFSVNAKNQLIETKYLATGLTNSHWNFNTTPQSPRVLSDSVDPTAPLFTYLTDQGTTVPVPTGGFADSTTLLSIRAITIALPVKSAGSNWSAVTLQNTVAMPNLGLTRSGTGS
ncbi:PulJ/GspJ family protein [Leifsonia poae]|uniref:PulJ/GspJ family protein n=1 Tax=Leifsonia poae TaxID=110933 RepID=UPI003D673610